MKLRYALPIAQVFLSVALFAYGDRQASHVVQDSPPYMSPLIEVCLAINAPVVVGVSLLHWLPFGHLVIGRLAFFAGVFVLWFVVGLEAESWRAKRHPASILPRQAADFVFVLVGVTCGFLAIKARWPTEEGTLVRPSLLVWSCALVGLYGVRFIRHLAVRIAGPHSSGKHNE